MPDVADRFGLISATRSCSSGRPCALMLGKFPVKRQPGVELMKAFMLFTGSGPLVVLTSHDAITDPALLRKFVAKGIDKFIAHEIPIALARQRYGGHFEVVLRDLHETDDLRILDYNGERAFRLFRLAEIGPAILHEPAHS